MSEYPWDMENMILAQHDQPCDCAICDDIHMARLMRRKRREVMNTSTTLNPGLAATVNQYSNREFGSMSVTDQLNREICRLREENERFKVMYKGFENQALTITKYRKALHNISLASQNSMCSMRDIGKEAREALEEQ